MIEILLYGEIGLWGDITAENIVASLNSANGEQIVVRINSAGGSFDEGPAIYSAMRRYSGVLDTEIDGIAQSMAAMLVQAGKTRRMAANAVMMVHGAQYGEQGSAERMRQTADMMDKFNESLIVAFTSRGIPEAKVRTWVTDGEDHFFTAEEAKAEGLIDEITGAVDMAAAMARIPKNIKLPPMLAAYRKNEENTMSDKKSNDGAIKVPTNGSEIDVSAFTATRDKNLAEGQMAGQKAEMNRQNEIRAFFARPQFTDHQRIGADNVAAFSDLMVACLSNAGIALGNAKDAAFDLLDGMPSPIVAVASQTQASESSFGRMDSSISTRSANGGSARQLRAAPGDDQRDKQVAAMSQSIIARSGQEKIDQANPYRGHTLMDLARHCLTANGVNIGIMASSAIAKQVMAAQTRSDFPAVLEDTMHKMILDGFTSQAGSWHQFCKVGSVSDLREYKRITPGLIGNLTPKDEEGNYRQKPIPDGEAEPISAKMVGNIIRVTAEVIINDDLDYIQTRARGVGQAGEATIDAGVYALLNSNPIMADGVALFHAGHANLADGTDVPIGDPNIDTVDQMAAAMAEQTAPAAKNDPDPSAQYLDILPYAYVAHRSRLSVLSVINASATNITQAPGANPSSGLAFAGLMPNANPMAGLVQEIATSVRAEKIPWYIFADPNVNPVIEVVFLNGQQAPRVTTEQDFNSSGINYKIELPHGVGAIGWRGAYKNAGA